ncbi:MAG TPA: hypothetical protein VMB21_17445, partial [Candidatus Limnocylindria bacterium]|nr:hypothetical protein [Candidatus Limnocylindria bacterium]
MSATPARRRRPSPIAPLVILGLVVLGMILVQTRVELDRNIRAWISVGLVLLGVLLEVIWLLGFSRLPWWQRLASVSALVAVFFALRFLTRKDGAIGGSGLPRLVWRWTPT